MDISGIKALAEGTLTQALSQKTETGFDEVLRRIEEMKGSLPSERTKERDEELMNACRELESVFIYELLKSMRATVPENELIPENQGEKIFKGMLDQEYSGLMSKTGGLGLAEIIYKQLSRDYAQPDRPTIDSKA